MAQAKDKAAPDFIPYTPPAEAAPDFIPAEPAGDTNGPREAAPEEGFFGSLTDALGLRPLLHPVEAAQQNAADFRQHPVWAAAEALDPTHVQVGAMRGAVQNLMENRGNPTGAALETMRQLPIVGGAVRMAEQAPAKKPGQGYLSQVWQAAKTPGVMGTGLGTALQAAPMALGGLDMAAPERPMMGRLPIRGIAQKVFAGKRNEPMPGTETTPAARYAAMRETGVQPDLAEATASPFLNQLKGFNENSIFAAPRYERAGAANIKALNEYTGRALNEMSPLEPEEGGAAVQKGLLAHHEGLKAAAAEGFDALDKQLKNQALPAGPVLRQEARQILNQNQRYYALHPELEPKRAMAIVRDIAGVDKTGKPLPARNVTYSEVHRLRSDLLEFNNSNPDLVKNQANGWIQRLAGAADEAITEPKGALNPKQVKIFRDANAAWKEMKDTYDNPQSPLYHAVRTTEPSTLATPRPGANTGVFHRTPEMAGKLQKALGPGIGPIQRGVAEGALRTTAAGPYNFKTFRGQLHRLPQGYREALYSPEQLQKLENIGQTGTVVNFEPNPSGSAKLGQKMMEGGALFNPLTWPASLPYSGGQYALGRLMNSPRVVKAIMENGGRGPIKPRMFLPATAGAGAVTAARGRRNQAQPNPWAAAAP